MPQNVSLVLHISSLGFGFLYLVLAYWAYDTGYYYACSLIEYECKRLENKPFYSENCPFPHGALLRWSLIICFFFWAASIGVLLTSLMNRQTLQKKPVIPLLACGIFMLIAVGLLAGFLVEIWKSYVPEGCTFNDEPRTFHGGPSIRLNGIKGRSVPEQTEDDRKTCQALTDYYFKYKLLIAAMLLGLPAAVLDFLASFFYSKETNRIGAMGMTVNAVGVQGNWQPQQQFGNGGVQMMTPSQNQFGGGQMMTPSQTQFPQQ